HVLVTCRQGGTAQVAVRSAGGKRLAGKVLIDVGNILPPQQRVPESLGEQIQKAFPQAKVVKALNTMNCAVMVDPLKVSDSHTVFISGNDGEAKNAVRELLQAFGWKDII